MGNRAQTAVEYLLLVGGALLLVAVVFLAVKANIFDSAARQLDDVSGRIGEALRGFRS